MEGSGYPSHWPIVIPIDAQNCLDSNLKSYSIPCCSRWHTSQQWLDLVFHRVHTYSKGTANMPSCLEGIKMVSVPLCEATYMLGW